MKDIAWIAIIIGIVWLLSRQSQTVSNEEKWTLPDGRTTTTRRSVLGSYQDEVIEFTDYKGNLQRYVGGRHIE